ncbi:MAG: xanthine dehydrogenase family protein molybdopterin-binding subunit [Dehalococcoidia bacterium]|nr:xanthine dehydrogenase family protein molybdopterin-binding subunit [Dehalococcoidia bacterium]
MTTVEQDAQQYRIIGTSPRRPDGVEKVTGRAVYGADVRLSGLLHGRVKRSPHAHAIIKRIDVSKALALPGVLAVVLHSDFPAPSEPIMQTIRGPQPSDWDTERIIARRKVLFRGHPVAAVAATDHHIAEDALELIEVEYEVLPAVVTMDDAIAAGAPILHDDGKADMVEGLFTPVDGRPTNIARTLELGLGDVEAGFAESEVVLERVYETAMAHQGYIEPHNATAMWNSDGKVTIWTSTQGAFGIRGNVSRILNLPLGDLKVVPAEIGGGFGAKNVVYLEPLAALLSKKTGRPVQITMNRTEVLEATGPTSGTRSWVRIGAKRDGTLVAADIRLEYEAGAYPGSPMPGGARCALGPYFVPNQRIVGYDIVLNRPKVAAYRAPGAPASEFAVESLLDELSERLQMDPTELRLKNAAVPGTPRSDGATHGSIGARETMEALVNHPHYRSEITGQDIGRGVAVGFWQNGGGESSAYANVHSDGRVTLITGSVDIGGQRAALAMQFAEAMGIAYEDITSLVGDTDSIGFTGNTGGSRTTFATGWAVYQAAMDVRKQLEERMARIWECDPSEVAYDPEDATLKGPEGKSMTFQEAARRLPGSGGNIQGQANVVSTNVGKVGACYGAHIADVHVDRETGKVTVLRYTAIQDVGKAIHRDYVEGQIQGGAVQGIGMALHEEYVYDEDGRMVNASFLDYRMPVANDLPMIETVLVEVPNPGHPYGVRGVGEVPIVPPLGAIANAIYDAVGVRVTRLPASPRVILEGLDALEGSAGTTTTEAAG